MEYRFASKTQHQQKTSEGFNRLPEEFTYDDVMRCFSLNTDNSVRNKVGRLIGDHLVERLNDARGKTGEVAKFRKVGIITQ